jgi:hypothetical protein
MHLKNYPYQERSPEEWVYMSLSELPKEIFVVFLIPREVAVIFPLSK